jgi:hypothetical protein
MPLPRENRPLAVDRFSGLNDPSEAFKNPAQLGFIRVLVDIIRRMSGEMVSQNTAAPHFILVSPNGTAYRVTVADDGTLTTVNARG